MTAVGPMHTFSTGTVVSSDDVADNFYNGVSGTSSFAMINGKLDNSNRDSWNISNKMIRPYSLARGRMVGNTGNLDYISSSFADDNTDADAYQPIPGCGIHFFLPLDPSVCILTWQIVYAGSLVYGDTKQLELKMYIDGTLQNRQFRTLPEGRTGSTRYVHRDRIWSGHVAKTNMTSGWHSAHVAGFLNQNTARIRIRNMKYVYFK